MMELTLFVPLYPSCQTFLAEYNQILSSSKFNYILY